MPIVVDAANRRQILGDAVWRIVARDGLAAASVRRIAEEAGLSTGSVRHFFPTQAALHTFAMELVSERIGQRVAGIELPEDPLEAAELALSQLLPLDDERRAENLVWLGFTAAALTDPGLAAVRRRAHDDLRSAARHWTGLLLPDATDQERRALEAEGLFAVIDGLAVHAAVSPETTPPELLRAVLRAHLEGLLAPDPTTPPSAGS